MTERESGGSSLVTLTLVQLLVGVLLFVALLDGQRDLIILTLLVLGLVGGARLWAGQSLAGLHCDVNIDKHRLFPGETLGLTIRAENAKLLPISLEIDLPVSNGLSSGAQVFSKSASLVWFERMQFQWELLAQRRGVYQIGPLQIRTGDLFSFFSRSRRGEAIPSILVYPRVVSLKPFSMPRRDFFGVPGVKSPVQDPIYILGTRDYQPGQPSKYIHWKASARYFTLQEKVFESTVQAKVLFVVNVDLFAERQAEDDFERTLEIVASLAVQFDRQGRSIGLVSNGHVTGGGLAVVPIARNYKQVSVILEMLARLEMEPETDLLDLLRHRLAETWGVSCIYFSHSKDRTLYKANEYLNQRRTPVSYFVCDARGVVEQASPELRDKVHRVEDLLAAEGALR